MKKLFSVALAFALTCCSSDINIFEHIDKNSSLYISISDSNSNSFDRRETEVPVNSEKYLLFSKWAGNNTGGWQMDPVSYVLPDITVSQNSFRLLYWVGKDNVVISFIDKNKKGRQYSKLIKKGELSFLAK